jgi:hypothetical protein
MYIFYTHKTLLTFFYTYPNKNAMAQEISPIKKQKKQKTQWIRKKAQ